MRHFIVPVLLWIQISGYSIEYKDTVLNSNQAMLLEFNVPNTFECGVNIYKDSRHSIESKITIDNQNNKVYYSYKPQLDYYGLDTVILVNGCMVNGRPDSVVADTIEYRITINKSTSINIIDFNKINLYFIDNVLIIDSESVVNSLVSNINVANISGQLIKQCSINTKYIDFYNLPDGIYLISFHTKIGMITKIIIK